MTSCHRVYETLKFSISFSRRRLQVSYFRCFRNQCSETRVNQYSLDVIWNSYDRSHLMSGLIARIPSTSKPSSVKVPVLSKHTTSNFPPILTLVNNQQHEQIEDKRKSYLWGLIQKIDRFFSLPRAKFVPIVRVAGNAGGTTIVIRSNALTITVRQESLCTS